jgi:hypothetical protein
MAPIFFGFLSIGKDIVSQRASTERICSHRGRCHHGALGTSIVTIFTNMGIPNFGRRNFPQSAKETKFSRR